MTIRHLRVFNEVCRHMNMTHASQNLHVSQPAISKTIRELENWYGLRLFERLNKNLYLTEAGKIVSQYASCIVEMFDKMDLEIREKSKQDVIRVGASVTAGTSILSDIIIAFKDKHYNLRIEVVIENTQLIEKLILDNMIDIALVEGFISEPDIVAKAFMSADIVLVCSEKHPLFHKEYITREDLSSADYIVREPGSGTRIQFEIAMRKLGISWKPTWVCHNTQAIKNAVAAGLGLGVLSKLSVRKRLLARKFRSIPMFDINIQQDFFIIHHKKKYMSKNLLAFKQHVIQKFYDLGGRKI